MVLNADKSYFLTAGYNELYPEIFVSDAAIEKLVKEKNLYPYLDLYPISPKLLIILTLNFAR